jgi:FkbM family methyltransferase
MLTRIKKYYWDWLVRRSGRSSKARSISPHADFDGIARNLPTGRDKLIYVDGGAYDGTMARKFMDHFVNLEVYAFEPVKETYERLAANLEGVPGKTYCMALSSSSGVARFHVNRVPGTSSVLPRSEEARIYHNHATETADTRGVPTTTLDQWLQTADVDHVDILKLDVQGMELEALRGAEEVLARGVSCLFIEMMFLPIYDGQPLFAEIDQFLRSRGYHLFNLYNQWTLQFNGQITSCDAIYVPRRAAAPISQQAA